MTYIDEIKSKSNILEIASELGYDGRRSGSCCQGNCPKHQSAAGNCLVIWYRTQSFHCFHCKTSGDVIDLVRLYNNCSFSTATDYLADRCGMARLYFKDLSEEEQDARLGDLKEKELVEQMLTVAAGWYHEQLFLECNKNIQDHLRNHYGFSDEIIKELRIGFAPPGTSSPEISSDLANHLESINSAFNDKLVLTGLFSFKDPVNGPFWDFFKGRIIFPYWKNGKVVYMAARATDATPTNQYECHTDKDGNCLGSDGKPKYIKYKKLQVHDPTHEKKKFVSKFIQNSNFMGEDSIRGQKEIIITEGAPDLVSALDKGFAAISPVTVGFRENDDEKLRLLTRNSDAIYLINDNEENQAGMKGALKTAKRLAISGRNVYIVELPRPEGKDKIDLNEYFVDHSADDLRDLIKNAKSAMNIMIEKLPEDFLKALPIMKEEIFPILCRAEAGILEHYVGLIKHRCKTGRKAIIEELTAYKKLEGSKKATTQLVEIDPETEKQAKEIALDPLLCKKRIDTINQSGVVAERKNIAMYFAALDSRLLPDDPRCPNTLAIKNSGHFGSGKSYTLLSCIEIYPKSCYMLITNGSPKSLYYMKEGLKNKALIVTEGFQFQQNNASDSELVYVVRSLISEGRICYPVVEKNDEGKLETVNRVLEGPTSFITTTVMESLEGQLEDRLFTIHPNESSQQTAAIINLAANKAAGLVSGLEQKRIGAWQAFHESLKPVNVVIPFAPEISKFINKAGGTIPIATRRAFNRVLTVIKTVTCAYQFQRKTDYQARLIAEICDYYMALQMVREAFRESMGQNSKETDERLNYIRGDGPLKAKNMATQLGISDGSLYEWVKPRVKVGVIVWCDKDGNEYPDDRALKKEKRAGRAFIKVSDSYSSENTMGLPTPFDLTLDPAWNENGELYKLYELDLDDEKASVWVSMGVKTVSKTDIDTHDSAHHIDIINDPPLEHGGVRVSMPNPDVTEYNNNLLNDIEKEDESVIVEQSRRLKWELEELDEDELDEHNQSITPLICRKNCVHYDGFEDCNDGIFKEFCWKPGNKNSRISKNIICNSYTDNSDSGLPEGILKF
jgi:DNA primase